MKQTIARTNAIFAVKAAPGILGGAFRYENLDVTILADAIQKIYRLLAGRNSGQLNPVVSAADFFSV